MPREAVHAFVKISPDKKHALIFWQTSNKSKLVYLFTSFFIQITKTKLPHLSQPISLFKFCCCCCCCHFRSKRDFQNIGICLLLFVIFNRRVHECRNGRENQRSLASLSYEENTLHIFWRLSSCFLYESPPGPFVCFSWTFKRRFDIYWELHAILD